MPRKTPKTQYDQIPKSVLIPVVIFGLFSIFLFIFNTNIINENSQNIVKNNFIGGAVDQVETWFDDNLNDPDSLKTIEWDDVYKCDDGSYLVRVKYRAKNLFGAYVKNDKTFFLDSSGNVTSVRDH